MGRNPSLRAYKQDGVLFWFFLIHQYWQHFPKKVRLGNHMLVPGGELLNAFNLVSGRRFCTQLRNLCMGIKARLVELPAEKQAPDKGTFCLENCVPRNCMSG